ncbi:MAG: DEAD/DEAH box helicase [Sandaracinaceae bacterium]
MRQPRTIEELEARLWSLAGDRMVTDTAREVLTRAGDRGERVARLSTGSVDVPVADFLADPRHELLHRQLGARDWGVLLQAFLTWGGDPRALAQLEAPAHRAIDSLEELPPPTPNGARSWAKEEGVEDVLAEPLSRVTPLIDDYVSRVYAQSLGDRRVLSAFEDRPESAPRRADIVSPERLRAAARSYLAYRAGRRRLVEARRSRWATGLPEPMRELGLRVRRLLSTLPTDEPPDPMPEEGLGVAVDAERMTFDLRFHHPQGFGPSQVSIFLVERVEDRARSSLDGSRASASLSPPWVRLAAERLLDALHDPESEVHQELARVLSTPRWHRLLAQLEETVVEAPPRAAFDDGERLVWRLAQDDESGQLRVHAAVQKRRKRGGWSAGRKLEHYHLEPRAERLEERDRRVYEAISRRKGRGGSDGRALEALVGHPRAYLEEDPKVPIAVRGVAVEVGFVERRRRVWLRLRVGSLPLEPRELLAAALPPGHVALLRRERRELLVAELPSPVRALAEGWARHETGLPAEADNALLGLLGRLPPRIGLELPPRLRGQERRPDVRPVVRLAPLPGRRLRAELGVRPLPTGPLHRPGEGPLHVVAREEDGTRVHTERDLGLERRAAERAAARLGLDAAPPDGAHAYRLDDPEAALDLVVALRELPDLVRAEWPEGTGAWEVVGEAGFSNLSVRTSRVADFFALRGEAAFDEGRVSLAQILHAVREGRRYVQISDGRFARIEEQMRADLERADDAIVQEGSDLAVAGAAVAFLDEILPADVLVPDADFEALKARIVESATLETSMPEGLRATLRPYQDEGVHWLLRLATWSPGAVLADDMGLGKTVQALALVLARADAGPSLVVAPTSVVDNWRSEAERFAPSLEPRLYRGPRREAELAGLGPRHLLLTSYDILARDAEPLGALRFCTVVFDEAHALKNPDTLRAQGARLLDGGFRVGLTGTPIENHLSELWSLFRIVVPGLLGPWEHFRTRFAVPIERDGDEARRDALRRLIRPFLLRRTKGQVERDLPPRMDVVLRVELSDDERALYEAERRSALDQLAGKAKDPTSRFAVLAALTRLRRLACHPALVHPETPLRSAKLDQVLSLADDLVAEGHRALVFSQFTSHLGLVRTALAERGHDLLYLDGSTPAAERAGLVERFQRGDMPFFLISLKAGGTGLNLTAADTVIHLDPWWNPAAEDQASDRSHRIGQDKPVTVLRLVSEGTIEEAVLELHAQKRELAEALLAGAESSAKLGTPELLELLSA